MKNAIKITFIDIADQNNYEKKDWSSEGLVIFSDEWNLRREQCENFIKAVSGQSTRRIHGRKCTVKEISKTQARNFLDTEHIQGANRLDVIHFGLIYQDELIAVMSLGRHSRQIAENRIVLDRFCVKSNVHVNGGASKLFLRCVEWAKQHKYDEIVSFSDNRWSDGDIYKRLNFLLEKEYRPDYCYVDVNNPVYRLSKQSQKKSSVKCPEGMTEFEWADARGLKKLWDCGKKRWVYPVNPICATWKENLSKRCAIQHQNGVFKQSHIRGYFKSLKNNAEIYYSSSYELRCLYMLENDKDVESFKRAEVFRDSSGGWRNPDLIVKFTSGDEKIYEVKPKGLLTRAEVIEQIQESTNYAKKEKLGFKVWTEDDSSLGNEKDIVHWAKRYIAETTGNTDWIERGKINNKKKAKRHYDAKIATNKISVLCDFCQEGHEVLKVTYNRNVKKNGRFICIHENGHLVGIKSKSHLKNPLESEGKKRCTGCDQIRDLSEFSTNGKIGNRKSECKPCRAKKYAKNYQKKGKRKSELEGPREGIKYKGVSFKKNRNQYQARLSVYHLGWFSDEIEAAENFDFHSLRLYGKGNCYLNFPNKDYTNFVPKREI